MKKFKNNEHNQEQLLKKLSYRQFRYTDVKIVRIRKETNIFY